MADNINVKDASGAVVSIVTKDTGSGQLYGHHIADPTTPAHKAGVTAAGALEVDGSGVTQPVSGSVTALPGTGATSLGKAEDAAHTSGDVGVMALAVRNDAGSALAGTDGDYIPLSTDSSGNLRVAATISAGGGTQYPEDGASAGGESLMLAGAVRRDTAASSSGTDGDYSTLNTDATGQLWTHVGASALPTGAATAANQATEITSLASLDTKAPALGQALAAASVPVVLPAAQITSLTPPAAITGFATAAKQPALGTAGSASADVLSVQGIASGTALGVSIADGSNATFGAEADGASAGDTTTTTFMALFKRLLQRITTLLAVFPTTIDTNSGNKSASTLRVAIATDQPQLTNALKVDPSAVTSPVSIAATVTVDTEFPAAAALADATANPTVPLGGVCLMVYNGVNGWTRLRAADTHKDLSAVAIGSIATVWTPASGKKVRLMGGTLSLSAAASILFEDNAAGTTVWRTPKLAADTPYNFDLGNGYLLSAGNNVLKATSSAAANVTGTLYGVEE